MATSAPRLASPERGLLLQFDAEGKELLRFAVAPELSGLYPDFGDYASAERLAAVDVNGDGREELSWLAKHYFFPSAIEVWWQTPESQAETLFINSGHLSGVTWADLDGDGRREAVTAGFNNRLGYQNIAAIVDGPPGPGGL